MLAGLQNSSTDLGLGLAGHRMAVWPYLSPPAKFSGRDDSSGEICVIRNTEARRQTTNFAVFCPEDGSFQPWLDCCNKATLTQQRINADPVVPEACRFCLTEAKDWPLISVPGRGRQLFTNRSRGRPLFASPGMDT